MKLDENVNERLTSWRVPQNQFTTRAPVTLRQLLSHTAGVNRPEGGFSHEDEYPSTPQILNRERPATNRPADIEYTLGTELRYSNFGYVIVQLLVEDVTGRPFAEVAREIVLGPVGMVSSTFEQPLPERLEDRTASPHDVEGVPEERFYNPNAVGQGGLWTTPSDLARFLIVICGVLSVFVVILTLQAWKGRLWTSAGRVYYSCVTLAALMGSWLWLAAG